MSRGGKNRTAKRVQERLPGLSYQAALQAVERVRPDAALTAANGSMMSLDDLLVSMALADLLGDGRRRRIPFAPPEDER